MIIFNLDQPTQPPQVSYPSDNYIYKDDFSNIQRSQDQGKYLVFNSLYFY